MKRFRSLNKKLLGLVACLLFVVAPLRAYGDIGFREHYERALDYYRHERYEAAIVEFEDAYAVRKLPRLLLNIGRAHHHLGRAAQALHFYEAFLTAESEPPADIKAEVDGYMADAREQIRAAQVRSAEQAPKEAPAGSTSQTSEEQPKPAEPPRPVPVTLTVPPTLPPPTARANPRPIYRRWWFWGIVGVAAAGAVVGAVLGTHDFGPTLPGNIRDQIYPKMATLALRF